MICQNAGHANIFEPVSVILMLQDKSSDRLNYVRSSMLEAKNRVFEFDYQKKNAFEFIQCSNNWCSSMFVKQFSKSSKGPIRFGVRCSIVRSQKWGVRVRWPVDKHVRVCLMFDKWCSAHHYKCKKPSTFYSIIEELLTVSRWI